VFIRYNETAKYYEKDTSVAQDGSGPWLILPIDYAQIYNPPAAGGGADEVFIGPSTPTAPSTELWYDTDAVPGSSLGNVAYKDVNNQFSTEQEIKANVSRLLLNALASPTNSRLFIIESYNGDLYFQARADDGTNPFNALKIKRDGSLFERQRGAAIGEWIPYTPTWKIYSSSNGVIGNGTLYGRYCLVGKICFFIIKLTIGSTTTFGSSYWAFSLPVSASSSDITGSAHCRQNSTSQPHNGQIIPGAYYYGFSDTVGLVARGSGTTYDNYVSGSHPFAWAVNDTMWMNGFYEIP
jgi:hypothetical protein